MNRKYISSEIFNCMKYLISLTILGNLFILFYIYSGSENDLEYD